MLSLLHRLYGVLALLLLPVCLMAQEGKVLIRNIKVVDAFTEKPLDKAHVSVMEKDSTTLLVDALMPRFVGHGDGGEPDFLGFQGEIPQREHIVLRIQCQGYPTEYRAWTIPVKKGKFPAQAYFPEGIYLWEEREQNLGEASVTASRILMVMKGDTIEYNAAAFRMHEGSMLDNLVRALPGVTLDDDGHIYVNGEFVKSLLVNGRDFFNGDPKIALRNLPAYTVSKVKVYRHSDRPRSVKDEPVSEAEKRNDPLVMDVNLKREYAQGWISNYEAGGGSTMKSPFDAKWMGRLFALRYTNHSSLGIYAAANNTNDGSTPKGKGEWSKVDATDGDKKTYLAGIHFSLEPKDKELEFNTTLNAKHEEALFQNRTIEETYYDNIRTASNSYSENNGKSTDLQWKARLKKSSPNVWHLFRANAYYRHNKAGDDSQTVNRQAQTGSDLDTLYSRNVWGSERETAWGTSLYMGRWASLNIGHLDIDANFAYNKREQTSHQRDRLIYKQRAENNVIEQRRFAAPRFDYNYSVDAAYYKTFKIGHFGYYVAANIRYGQEFNSGHQDLTRNDADWLAPSAATASWGIDELNTYHTTRMERQITFDPHVDFSYKTVRLSLSANLISVFRRISDLRAGLEQEKTPNDFIFNPYVGLAWDKGAHHWGAYGMIDRILPELTYLIDVADSSDPLWRREGNSGLHATRKYSVATDYKFVERYDYMRHIELKVGYYQWENSVSYARFYDRTSGVTTMKPMNINGIWRAWAKGVYSRLMGKDKNWNLSNTFDFSFDHSLDYLSDLGMEMPVKSAVDNLNLRDEFRIDYRIKEMRIGVKANVSWTQQESLQHRFARNSFTQFNYGITLSAPLLWDIHFASDIMAYSRRGYRDASMNTTDWVWNAELSRPLGKHKQWVVKAIGFDLLQQISSIRRTVNAQGWTESRYNTKPSYAMLSIFYRLDVKPKKTFQKK